MSLNVWLKGALVLLGSLDRETTPSYELVIEVSDGGIDGDNVLSASTTVTVTVVGSKTSSPRFDSEVYNVNVTEETTRANIVTVNSNRVHRIWKGKCPEVTCSAVLRGLKRLNSHCPNIRTYHVQDMWSWFDEHEATVHFKWLSILWRLFTLGANVC